MIITTISVIRACINTSSKLHHKSSKKTRVKNKRETREPRETKNNDKLFTCVCWC